MICKIKFKKKEKKIKKKRKKGRKKILTDFYLVGSKNFYLISMVDLLKGFAQNNTNDK